jgi:predicted phosphodiesterase
MKIALISDIHGNIDALEAVLKDAQVQGVEGYAFLGDYIFDLPFANDVVRRIRALPNATFISGNKEALLDRLAGEDQSTWTHNQVGVIYQTYRELSEADRNWLCALPDELTVTLPSGRRLYCAHYLPGCRREGETMYDSSIVFDRQNTPVRIDHAQYNRGLERFYNESMYSLISSIDADIIAYGHNHLQGYGRCAGRPVIDAGSCGLPMDHDTRAAYTILDDGAKLGVIERRVEYDIESAIERARTTSICRASEDWSRLTFYLVRTACDRVGRLFEIAQEIADGKGETGGLFENDTLHEAMERLAAETPGM